MAATIKKQPDGDVSLGNWNGEMVALTFAAADYATGGYAVVGGATARNNGAPNTQNVDLWKVYGAVILGGVGGYIFQFNQATQSFVVYQQSAATGALTQVPAGTDLSALTVIALLLGQ